jgi:hypothetical protein
MRADARTMTGAKADTSPLLGTWVNAKKNTDHIAKAVISERDGGLLVRLYGSADEPVDWGETEAIPYAVTGTTEVAGFHARYTLDGTRVEIAANVKLGILVIQAYTSFQDDRLSHYSREFFYQSAVAAKDGEARSLRGDWVNSNPATEWIKEFTIAGDTLHIQGANEPADWGETGITTYLDNIGEPAFHAEYDLRAVEAVLAGNTNKNLIVIAAFFRFKDGESPNFLCREFFVQR